MAVSIFAFVYFLTQKDGAYAIILKDGEQIGSFSLSQNEKIPIRKVQFAPISFVLSIKLSVKRGRPLFACLQK